MKRALCPAHFVQAVAGVLDMQDPKLREATEKCTACQEQEFHD